ncbi:ATP-dependent zinc protease [Thiomicrorhabdus sp. Kp2]|uniref:ATP-dependent zinc protease family protein n=1 Tax=Thiomicrorhabdus sp. Kp2 TaxID=1123518 RepID=UPI000428B0F7|nr:ATP-dependent zinc protease [Thiomicrorhabdus sp. Kp2]
MSKTVGWCEWVRLPELGIERLECKVDTGAKNSALHAFEVDPFQKDGQEWVRFSIHIDDKDLTKIKTCEALVQDIRTVTDSGGNNTERFFIETALEIGDFKLQIPISLTSRDTMAFKMLLGRTALRKAGLIVDSAESYLQGIK